MLLGKESKAYGETSTSEADTTELLAGFFGAARGVTARVGGQVKGYGPNTNAAADPGLCGEG